MESCTLTPHVNQCTKCENSIYQRSDSSYKLFRHHTKTNENVLICSYCRHPIRSYTMKSYFNFVDPYRSRIYMFNRPRKPYRRYTREKDKLYLR